MTMFVGETAVTVYQCVVLKTAIGLMEKGIKPNKAYTRKNVCAAVGKITGKTYAWKDHEQMKKDLDQWVTDNRSKADIRP